MTKRQPLTVDANKLMENIQRSIEADMSLVVALCEVLEQHFAGGFSGGPAAREALAMVDRRLAIIASRGIAYDIPRLLLRRPPRGERNKVQRVLRSLEAAGFIQISGRRAAFLQVTARGRELLAAGAGVDDGD